MNTETSTENLDARPPTSETVSARITPPRHDWPPPPQSGIHDAFIHLWTRLNEASWRAAMLDIIAGADDANRQREDALGRQIGDLWEMNRQLRAELEAGKKAQGAAQTDKESADAQGFKDGPLPVGEIKGITLDGHAAIKTAGGRGILNSASTGK